MSEPLLLGIDAGTSVIKAAVFDSKLSLRGLASRRTEPIAPRPGWSEADPRDLWKKTCAVVREVLDQCGGSIIAGVGISGNMVGAWLIDATGQPVRNAILWNDARSQSIIDILSTENPGFLSQVFESSGSVMQQGCTLPIVRWLAENEPQTLRHAAHVLTCKDWIRFNLTGLVATDPTEASVMPGDIRGRDYNEAMFTLLGVERWRELWPSVVPSEAVCGVVTESAAVACGIPAGTPVVGGLGDVPATILGADAAAPGTACVILGTTCLSCLSIATPAFTPRDVGLHFALPGAGWARVMANIAGTTNLDWFAVQFYAHERNQIGNEAAFFRLLEQEAERSGAGAHGLIYLPYLSEAGIIAPVIAPGARAQFSGLNPAHTRQDMLRAVYEGVAYAIRDCFMVIGAPLTRLQFIGGGAKSPLWGQMIADICGVPVSVPAGAEFGARGAALVAGIGTDTIEADTAPTSAANKHLYAPRPDLQSIYESGFERYRSQREALTARVHKP